MDFNLEFSFLALTQYNYAHKYSLYAIKIINVESKLNVGGDSTLEKVSSVVLNAYHTSTVANTSRGHVKLLVSISASDTSCMLRLYRELNIYKYAY